MIRLPAETKAVGNVSGPRTMVRDWFEQLWNQKCEDTIDRLLAPHGLVYGLPTPDNQPLRGPDQFKAVYRQFRQAFPNPLLTPPARARYPRHW
jgi:hypothetical protein